MKQKELTEELLQQIVSNCKKELDGLSLEEAKIILSHLKEAINGGSIFHSSLK